ncbi:hypothetical protein T4D_1229 [Trichinella pseudospiralis]|uniref:Uncharacterized protein n=1 Tax=Trichinella pseudospiralis TaxID=6337 RepID=A0A0V1G485_TRIPS|nr:hypothetical protein T4D_1229 [Trichinella pseudospiralis]
MSEDLKSEIACNGIAVLDNANSSRSEEADLNTSACTSSHSQHLLLTSVVHRKNSATSSAKQKISDKNADENLSEAFPAPLLKKIRPNKVRFADECGQQLATVVTFEQSSEEDAAEDRTPEEDIYVISDSANELWNRRLLRTRQQQTPPPPRRRNQQRMYSPRMEMILHSFK